MGYNTQAIVWLSRCRC